MAEYIEREAVIKLAESNKAVSQALADIVDIREIVNDVPSADVEPVVHAKLIQVRKESFWCETIITEKCSRCGRKYTRKDIQPQINYCCICGVKMDGGKSL